jgi:hypothetical protein
VVCDQPHDVTVFRAPQGMRMIAIVGIVVLAV